MFGREDKPVQPTNLFVLMVSILVDRSARGVAPPYCIRLTIKPRSLHFPPFINEMQTVPEDEAALHLSQSPTFPLSRWVEVSLDKRKLERVQDAHG